MAFFLSFSPVREMEEWALNALSILTGIQVCRYSRGTGISEGWLIFCLGGQRYHFPSSRIWLFGFTGGGVQYSYSTVAWLKESQGFST